MANSNFRFKQFEINQDRAAMKVGTDGVLLGAWVDVNGSEEILDIGTGTGVIALMLAQRNSTANITAIDIEKDALQQAEENFKISPWKSRLSIGGSALSEFAEGCYKRFDLIVCNPPYFRGSLKSNDIKRNMARHNDSLPFNQLISLASKLLTKGGRFSVIMPSDLEIEFTELIVPYQYNLIRRLNVKPTCNKPVARVLLEFSLNGGSIVEENTIVIEDKGRHGYSDDFKKLTKDFYLNF